MNKIKNLRFIALEDYFGSGKITLKKDEVITIIGHIYIYGAANKIICIFQYNNGSSQNMKSITLNNKNNNNYIIEYNSSNLNFPIAVWIFSNDTPIFVATSLSEKELLPFRERLIFDLENTKKTEKMESSFNKYRVAIEEEKTNTESLDIKSILAKYNPKKKAEKVAVTKQITQSEIYNNEINYTRSYNEPSRLTKEHIDYLTENNPIEPPFVGRVMDALYCSILNENKEYVGGKIPMGEKYIYMLAVKAQHPWPPPKELHDFRHYLPSLNGGGYWVKYMDMDD